MKNKKVITGTMVARWAGILTLIVVTIVFIIECLRSDSTILKFFNENWIWLVSGLAPGIFLLALTAKKKDSK